MLNLTSKKLIEYAQERGFLRNEFEKSMRLMGVLKEMNRHHVLQRSLALKGGTALNLFVYDIPRLSVDVDFNYVGTIKKSKMEKGRAQITQIIPSLFSSHYNVQISKDEYALLQYEFQYQTISGGSDKLKLDINFLHRLPIMPPVQSTFDQFGQSVSFTLLGLEELLAGKVVALLTRYAPRDLYDIYQTALLKPSLDFQLLRSLIRYYGLISRIPVLELFQLTLDQVSDYDIRRHLHPMLIRGQFPQSQKMIEKVQEFLTPLLSFSQEEVNVIDHFYSHGDLNGKILFPQEELRERINKSPALAWRCEQINRKV